MLLILVLTNAVGHYQNHIQNTWRPCTTSKLYPAKNGCNKCGGKISWDLNARKELNTNLPLNLDGTIHDSTACYNVQLANTLPEKDKDKQSSTYREDIQKAHEENMAASEGLRFAILALSKNIETLSIMIKTYFQSRLDQEQQEQGK